MSWMPGLGTGQCQTLSVSAVWLQDDWPQPTALTATRCPVPVGGATTSTERPPREAPQKLPIIQAAVISNANANAGNANANVNVNNDGRFQWQCTPVAVGCGQSSWSQTRVSDRVCMQDSAKPKTQPWPMATPMAMRPCRGHGHGHGHGDGLTSSSMTIDIIRRWR